MKKIAMLVLALVCFANVAEARPHLLKRVANKARCGNGGFR